MLILLGLFGEGGGVDLQSMLYLLNIENKPPAEDSGRTDRVLTFGKTMRIKLLYITVLLLALSGTGCSTAYDMMEIARVKDCESLRGQEHTECLEQAIMPYEEYKQERARDPEREQ
ncbi:MAG: hypothetical protein D3904_00475 [Candidatus Electrothrix sp. EH2]|nr:hypothetical protein [Candidatus Electrothrix sp. EH2]